MTGRSRYLRALTDPRFYRLLLGRIKRGLQNLVGEYEDSTRKLPQEDKRVADARFAFRNRKDILLGQRVVLGDCGRIEALPGAYVNDDAQLNVPPNLHIEDPAAIRLGRHTYIGRRTELTVGEANVISIGDYTKINDNCVLLADVTIERHCLVSYAVYISSGEHQTRFKPTWLIRDQDAAAAENLESLLTLSKRVHIEEDCLIGYGVFIRRGVYIGRGAVIGANSVVIRDVPPYSMQGGAPNREVSRRLDWQPPAEISGLDESHWPYFYAGFLVKQPEIRAWEPHGLLGAGLDVRIMLAGGRYRTLRLQGALSQRMQKTELQILINGSFVERVTVSSGAFELNLPLTEKVWEHVRPDYLPPVLQRYNEVRIQSINPVMVSPKDEPESYLEPYGLSRVSLLEPVA